ncbi:MAG: exodeoxyribonuclease VII large subunit [Phormidium sp. BM_Day4_Bin.17]|nr:exodeoxyribonuclease VII large subunit [Phormidium sp. BM_Day4_Bin.17]UCJ12931.1 MAG: exodeoxyribonuclease VII large subunit [Phormidium sp. PBR-2020]
MHPSDLPVPEGSLTVAGVTDYIQSLLEDNPQLRPVWVVGEVSSCKTHPSGLFFTLRDRQDDSILNGVIWKSQVAKLSTPPKLGELVVVGGTIRLFRGRGQYQLYGFQVLALGAGMQALQYQQLRNRLMAEGLFDPRRKRSLPEHPQTIAVVTSPQAAAWGDIQSTLRQRYPGIQVLLSPTGVQGDRAAASIERAIARVVADGRAELVILARGGGSSEDLAVFNDERVVRAVALCPYPVITGIGHQRDESLADLAADFAAETPTAAAKQAVPDLQSLIQAHRDRQQRLEEVMITYLGGVRSHLHQLRQRLDTTPIQRQLNQEQQQLRQLKQRLIHASQQRLQQAQQRHQFLRDRLTTINPQIVLDRGYAVVRNAQGEIVRTTEDLKPGRVLSVKLAQGWVKVKITSTGIEGPAPFSQS